jgi:hypothetical protein
MKKDEVILGVSVAWTVERYVTLSPKGKVGKAEEKKEERGKKKETQKPAAKKAKPAKKKK